MAHLLTFWDTDSMIPVSIACFIGSVKTHVETSLEHSLFPLPHGIRSLFESQPGVNVDPSSRSLLPALFTSDDLSSSSSFKPFSLFLPTLSLAYMFSMPSLSSICLAAHLSDCHRRQYWMLFFLLLPLLRLVKIGHGWFFFSPPVDSAHT